MLRTLLPSSYSNSRTKSFEYFNQVQEQSLQKRQRRAQEIRSKYPNRYPIMVDRLNGDDPKLDRHKFLVPSEFNVGQLIYVVRTRMKIRPEIALYFFSYDPFTKQTTGSLTPSMDVSQLFIENCSNDHYLYIGYTSETAFGSAYGSA